MNGGNTSVLACSGRRRVCPIPMRGPAVSSRTVTQSTFAGSRSGADILARGRGGRAMRNEVEALCRGGIVGTPVPAIRLRSGG